MYDKVEYVVDQQAEPASPFDRLTLAVGELEGLLKFATVLSDRLAGAPPSQTSAVGGEVKGSGPGGHGGLLSVVDLSADRINLLRRLMSDKLTRIEERL